jgi:hypothetical protein
LDKSAFIFVKKSKTDTLSFTNELTKSGTLRPLPLFIVSEKNKSYVSFIFSAFCNGEFKIFIPLVAFAEFPPKFFCFSNKTIFNFPFDFLYDSYVAVTPANPAPTTIISYSSSFSNNILIFESSFILSLTDFIFSFFSFF